MRPLSIAVVRQRFAQDGGAERFVARMLEALKGQDVQITLITREWQPVDGVRVITVKPFYLGRLWRDWSFARAVCRLLKLQQFDLVQSHERIACCDIYRAGDGVHREWLKQLARVRGPLGRLGIAINPYHLYVKWAEKRLFIGPRLKAVICNSRMVKEEIREGFGVPDEKLHVIYNGVDTESFHPHLKEHRAAIRARYDIPETATLFLFVGSGFERKGVAALLEAMAKLPDDTYLLIVGRDKRAARYERRARALGLTGRVQFAGSQPDVRPYYGAADALVLPTLYDPFPNVIPEAMASGLPVVTSTKSGGAELLDVGNRGFVCDALDADRLAICLRQLTGNVSVTMGAAARRTLEAQTLENMGARLAALYQTMTAVSA